MKKIIVIISVLAAMVTAALVFTFCTKEIKTETDTVEKISNAECFTARKATPYCFAPAELVQLELSSGTVINVCIKCDQLKEGRLETCFNLEENDECNPPYPATTCCPYPIHIEYRMPFPLTTENLRNPYNWQWAQTEWGNCTCINNLPSEVSAGELIQIVGMSELAFCFD